MMCAACTSAIEKALQNLDGVSWVRVNLGGETATAKYDPSKIKLVDIEKAIRDLGYDVIDQQTVLKIGGDGLCHVRGSHRSGPEKAGWRG